MKTLFLACSLLTCFLNFAYTQEASFTTQDQTYVDFIRNVQIHPNYQTDNAQVLNPIIPLGQRVPLLLSFDQINGDMSSYSFQILNCNADWTVSGLNPTEYLDQYNDFTVFDNEFSINTKVDYTHYAFEVPHVKLAGNYVVKIYQNGDEDDVVLTRRFMVYDESILVGARVENVVGAEEAGRKQQINFWVNYANVNLTNPQQQIKVVVRQNNRWDNAITDLEPTFIRAFDKRLEYNHFNLENTFDGGNEFRMFDTRSLRPQAWSVDSVFFGVNNDVAHLFQEKIRQGWAYNRQFEDINGKYAIELKYPSSPQIEADYVHVNFYLKSANEYQGNVYVFGALSDWQCKEAFKMEYLEDKQLYHAKILLKQGIYNYIYALEKPNKLRDDRILEGSYRQTTNDYDILVYFRPFGARTDYLLGYRSFQSKRQ
jgi:hypothetical protein